MAIPTAPGKNFLRATGIFYILTGGLSIVISLVVRYSPSGDGYNWLYATAIQGLPIWSLTIVNGVMLIYELLFSISAMGIFPTLHNAFVVYMYPLHRHAAELLEKGVVVSRDTGAGIFTWLVVVLGIVILLMGIIATKYCDTLKHTKLLAIFSLTNLIIMTTSTIIGFFIFPFLVFFLSLLGCGIAVLYFVGAFKNFKQI